MLRYSRVLLAVIMGVLIKIIRLVWNVLLLTVCCPNGTYGLDCEECAGGRAQPCNGNGHCVVSMLESLCYW